MKPQTRGIKAPARGIYLLLAALLMAGLAFALLQVVELSQQVQKQTEIEQVAQYAAEALGIIAARDLNIKAISNRAMVANEMAIGQIIGFHTWYEMTRETSTNMALISAWIPYVNSVTFQIARLLNQLQQPMRTGIQAALALQRAVISGLSGFQWAFHQAAWLSSIATATDIVEGTEKDLEIRLLNHQTLVDAEYLWLRMQKHSRDLEHQEDYAQMVSDSRDSFSERRTYSWVNVLGSKVYRAGGSEIKVNNQGQLVWQSLDTHQLHLDLWVTNAYIPIGGGASYLTEALPRRRSTEGFGDSYQLNWTTSRATARRGHRFLLQPQAPAYYRLQDAEGITKKPPQITLVVQERGGSDDEPRLWGMGRSEIYFQRPNRFWPRADDSIERANLHNALWQVRPKNISEVDRKLIGAQL
ncbi:hypothetical protein CWE08_06570 [Aliidiomarina iranensis]|uniref:Uncharacterized protein n=1 Tax=Aliidiomarina iranensis TaxID=1434071 RepID=A0A432VX33_9GAMM|nr:hypothetical protein [Aliidiomarina iranensis]RUO21240.1 hypothetical protein CWE08_06570 [Aliidiomarina iranensis]